MPDIDFQKIVLNLIPKKGDEPVIFYASQYETTRPFIADLFWGDTEFAPGDDCWAEIDIRKNDDNLVVITDDVSIDNNEVSVILPVQAVTCIGNNLGQIKIYAADDQLIAALNFILHVQPDPLAGGVTSESEIDNLESQIAAIVPEVIGEDYYDKTEVDALLNDKADVSDLPDMSQYYDKTETDALLADKADAATTYTKSETDSLLAAKANTADLATVATTGDYDDLINKPTIPAAQVQSDYAQADNTQVDYIKNKPDISGMIAVALLAVMPVESATGNPCTFDSDIATSLVGLSADIVASGGNGTPSTPIPIVGHSELNLTRCGINQFDEQTETGYYDSTTGEKKPLASEIRSTNLISVMPETTYVKVGLMAGYSFTFFDSAKNFLSRYTSGGLTFTTPANCYYIGINFGANYGNTYNNDVSINYPASDTAYHAYNGQTFTVAFGQTVYGGVYDANAGKVTITFGVINDLGLLNWNYGGSTGHERFTARLDGAKRPALNSQVANILCSCYVADSADNTYLHTTDLTIALGATDYWIYVYDSNYSDADTFKNSLSGQTLIYELATPIEIDVSSISVEAVSGTNTITSDCNGDVTAQYKVSIQKYIDDNV